MSAINICYSGHDHEKTQKTKATTAKAAIIPKAAAAPARAPAKTSFVEVVGWLYGGSLRGDWLCRWDNFICRLGSRPIRENNPRNCAKRG